MNKTTNPYTRVTNRILDERFPDMTHTAKALCMALCRLTEGWHRKEVICSIGRMSRQAGISQRSVHRGKKALCELGVLDVSQRKIHGRLVTTWRLTDDHATVTQDPCHDGTHEKKHSLRNDLKKHHQKPPRTKPTPVSPTASESNDDALSISNSAEKPVIEESRVPTMKAVAEEHADRSTNHPEVPAAAPNSSVESEPAPQDDPQATRKSDEEALAPQETPEIPSRKAEFEERTERSARDLQADRGIPQIHHDGVQVPSIVGDDPEVPADSGPAQPGSEQTARVDRLRQVGVSSGMAQRLVNRCPAEVVDRALDNLPFRKAQNPAAYVVQELLDGGWATPKVVILSENRTKVERLRRHEREEEARLHDQEDQEYRNRFQQALGSLSPEEKKRLLEEARDRVPAWARHLPDALEEGSPILRATMADLLEQRVLTRSSPRVGLKARESAWSDCRRVSPSSRARLALAETG